MWYVVQVCTGQEDTTCQQIRAAVSQSEEPQLLEECFVPKYVTLENTRSEGQRQRIETLFPGYLIVDTKDVEKLTSILRSTRSYTRVLRNGDQFIPLTEQERSWIEAFTQRDNRVIDVSEGYQEGDEIVVTSGPLMNHTAWIRKINHRKKLAYLELEMFGRTIHAQVGLRIVRKRD